MLLLSPGASQPADISITNMTATNVLKREHQGIKSGVYYAVIGNPPPHFDRNQCCALVKPFAISYFLSEIILNNYFSLIMPIANKEAVKMKII